MFIIISISFQAGLVGKTFNSNSVYPAIRCRVREIDIKVVYHLNKEPTWFEIVPIKRENFIEKYRLEHRKPESY